MQLVSGFENCLSHFRNTITDVLGGCDMFKVADLLSTLQNTLLQGHMTGRF